MLRMIIYQFQNAPLIRLDTIQIFYVQSTEYLVRSTIQRLNLCSPGVPIPWIKRGLSSGRDSWNNKEFIRVKLLACIKSELLFKIIIKRFDIILLSWIIHKQLSNFACLCHLHACLCSLFMDCLSPCPSRKWAGKSTWPGHFFPESHLWTQNFFLSSFSPHVNPLLLFIYSESTTWLRDAVKCVCSLT